MAVELLSNECPFYKGRECPGAACEIEKDCVVRVEEDSVIAQMRTEIWVYSGLILLSLLSICRDFLK